MATKKKLLQAAAGTAAASGGGGAGGLNVESVFSTYLYEGNGSSQVIENGINLGQSFGSGSVFLSKGALKIADDASFQFGTGDWTIEMFVNLPEHHADGTSQSPVLISWGQSSTDRFDMGWQTASLPRNFCRIGGTSYQAIASVATWSYTNYVGQWVHVAATRNGSTIRMFVDGTEVASDAISGTMPTPSTDGVFIGTRAYTGGAPAGNEVTGYISNIRIVKGTALYTSSFTVPTSELTAVSGTSLLAFTGDEPFTDSSSNAHTITPSGNFTDAIASTFGPFDAADAGEGGMVWIKDRTSGSHSHVLYDTNRGINKALLSDNATSELTRSSGLTSFNSNGFSVGSLGAENNNGSDFASWTCRKAPKFFDVVTWTGNEVVGREISHNLGAAPGLILVKRTSSTRQWAVYHRSQGATKYGILNSTDAFATSSAHWNNTEPTSTHFTVGDSGDTNNGGNDYVAYLFAHNDGDGEFGPDGDADIIKCGSYTGNGSSTGPEIDLGFEPQLVLLKVTSQTSDWLIFDNMRGIVSGGNDAILYPDLSSAEVAPAPILDLLPTGFKLTSTSASVNGSGGNYIYMAIRRGPMAVPTDATDVFAMDFATSSGAWTALSGFPIDFILYSNTTSGSDNYAFSRLNSPNYMRTNLTNGETGYTVNFDRMDGIEFPTTTGDYSTWINWMWRRAPSFCDVVAYTGNGTAGRTVPHGLTVPPEMMWVKCRTNTYSWSVYHKGCNGGVNPEQYRLVLNDTNAESANSTRWNDTAPTDSVFTLGTASQGNGSGEDYIAYLFASLDGVSKVGSYTGTGAALNIDCGFSSGARFVMIKRADGTGSWEVWDTERGIVSGSEGLLRLNSTAAEITADWLDPYSSGFQVSAFGPNAVGGTYIFYAIA